MNLTDIDITTLTRDELIVLDALLHEEKAKVDVAIQTLTEMIQFPRYVSVASPKPLKRRGCRKRTKMLDNS